MRIHADTPDAVDFAKYPDALAPAVVQDPADGAVLMLGYLSAESLARTFATGLVTFHSRSRGRLWTKGETSGHRLAFVAAYADCDRDAVLVHARPHGPTCHTGADTCFGQPPAEAPSGKTDDTAADLAFLTELGRLLHARQPDADAASYTSRLLARGPMKIAQKVGEEGVEVALEAVGGTDELLLEESADLLYHLLLLLRSKGKRLGDVVAVLRKRHRPT